MNPIRASCRSSPASKRLGQFAMLRGYLSARAGKARSEESTPRRNCCALILAIILLIIAIAGGVIVHPILFALALVALVLFFTGRRGAAI